MPLRSRKPNPNYFKKFAPFAAALLVAAAMAGLAFLYPSANIPGTGIRLEATIVWVLAATMAAAVFLPPFRTADRLYILAAAGLGLILLFGVFHRAPRFGDRTFGLEHWSDRIYLSGSEWYEPITAGHETYGFSGAPNANGLHLGGSDKLIRYTLDEGGWRNQQKETLRPNEIWFLGSELPFGFGVMDGEGFVDRLSIVWREYKVRNFSHKWFSTGNAYRILEQQIRSSVKPKAVMLAWSSMERVRNYRRKSWFRTLPNLSIPVFDDDHGKPRFVGMESSRNADGDDGPETDRKETQVTEALIRGMAEMCAKEKVPFVLLLFRNQERRMVENLRNEPNLSIWDLTEVERSFPLGGRDWHQAIAHQMLTDRFLATLLEDPALLSPDSYLIPKVEVVRQVSQPASMEFWHLDGPLIKEAKLTLPGPDRVRISFEERKFRGWWDVKLVYPVKDVNLKAGETYSLEWRTKAKEVKPLLSRIVFTKGESEITREATVTGVWQNVRQTFVAPSDASIKQIEISAGRDSIQFEVAGLRLYSDKTDRDVLSPSSKLEDAEQPPEYWLPEVSKLLFWSDKWYNNAALQPPSSPGEPLRVTQRGWRRSPGSVQVRLPFQMKKGSTYSVHFDVRSTDPRKLSYAVILERPPWTILADGGEIVASIQWQRFELGFFADKDIPTASFALYLGGSEKPVEIRSMQVLEDGRNLYLPRPAAAAAAATAVTPPKK